MPTPNDTSRRGFLIALAGLTTALAAPKEGISLPPPEWNPLASAGPIVDYLHFSFWKQTNIHKAGNYTLLRAEMPYDFLLRSIAMHYDPSVRLDTLKAFMGFDAPTYEDAIRDSHSIRLIANGQEYFSGPVHMLPWTGGIADERLPIIPEICIPKGSIVELRGSGRRDLDAVLAVSALFEGVLRAPSGMWPIAWDDDYPGDDDAYEPEDT